MLRFSTKSGSIYEVDREKKLIRRVYGNIDPTTRQGKNGEWKKYAEFFPNPIEVGKQVLIKWGDEVPLFPDSPKEAFPGTLTSLVTKVEDSLYN